MITVTEDTKVDDIETYFYLGEYDEKGIIEKLYNMRVYCQSQLMHTDKSQRGVEIYFSRFTYENLTRHSMEKSHHPKITFSRFRTLGQGMYGKIAYCSGDMTIKEVMRFLETFHLRLTLTKHK